MAITAALVKELRDSTGAGMMDAKKALTETDGDMEAAVDWLRTKGLAKAAKKSGRTAAEGLVAVQVSGGKGVAVEVNSETDFVGKNAEFQDMVGKIAQAATGVSNVEELAAASVGGKVVADMITDKIATLVRTCLCTGWQLLRATQSYLTCTTQPQTAWAKSVFSWP